MGWTAPALWDDVAGNYRTKDGWVRLHTNAPHHRTAAEAMLGSHADRTGMARAVAAWNADPLEAAVVAAGGCAAALRTAEAWALHPQGAAVAAEPLVAQSLHDAPAWAWRPERGRPLHGVRVLDLTRVLAGPVASRFLAGYGAEVLRIDPPWWTEPAIEPEMTLGKRCARLDARDPAGHKRLAALLATADVVLHGYRPGALDGLNLGAGARRALAPGLVDVSLCAYGWTGPWSGRRGFDSLVQMSSGIAHGADEPTPLPVQALDHATGYLMAAAALRGITRRRNTGGGTTARLSLARTGGLLTALGPAPPAPILATMQDGDFAPGLEMTAWGPLRRLRPPAKVAGAPMRWDVAAGPLGAAAPAWL